jgi:hypothetical protein
MLWADRYGDDDDYTSNTKNYSSSRNYSTSRSDKKYATDGIPGGLQDEVLEIFSDETVSSILELPDTVESLRQWSVSKLSFSGSDISKKIEEAINRAVQDLCSIANRKDPSFCKNNRTLIKQIVEGTFYEKKTNAIKQLLQFAQTTIQEEKKKLKILEKKATDIKRQEPDAIRKIHADDARIRREGQILDKQIKELEKKLKQQYTDENEKGYDQQTLLNWKEDKQLLIEDAKHLRHDLDKQKQEFKKIKEQEHILRADLESIEDMPKEISIALKRRKDSVDLRKAWDKINRHFAKLEERKKRDKSREDEEAREIEDKRKKEDIAEEKEQAQEMQMLEGFEKKVSDPEATEQAKKAGGLFSEFFKGIGAGG